MSGAATDPLLSGYFSALTSWDWGLGLTGLVSGLMGFWRGFVRTLAHLAAWMLSFFAAPLLSRELDRWSASFSALDAVPRWVQLVLTFLTVFVLVRFSGRLLLSGVRRIGLGGIDRLFGTLFGLMRALLIVGAVAVVAYRLGLSSSPSWRNAQCRPLLDAMVQLAQPMLPPPQRPATTGI